MEEEESQVLGEESVESSDDMDVSLITNVKQESHSDHDSEEDSAGSDDKLHEITDVKPTPEVNLTPIRRKFDPRVIEFLRSTRKKRKREVYDEDVDWQPPGGVVADPVMDTGVEDMKKEFEIEILESEMIRSKKGKLVTYKCSVCAKFYSANPRAKGFFVKHKLTHMIGTVNGVECDQCDNKFESRKELSRHQ